MDVHSLHLLQFAARHRLAVFADALWRHDRRTGAWVVVWPALARRPPSQAAPARRRRADARDNPSTA